MALRDYGKNVAAISLPAKLFRPVWHGLLVGRASLRLLASKQCHAHAHVPRTTQTHLVRRQQRQPAIIKPRLVGIRQLAFDTQHERELASTWRYFHETGHVVPRVLWVRFVRGKLVARRVGGPTTILRFPTDHQTRESSPFAAHASLHDKCLSRNDRNQLAKYALRHSVCVSGSLLMLQYAR